MTSLREAARAAVAALRNWESAAEGSNAEMEALFQMRMAVRELERLTSEDGPMPSDTDLAGLCKGILLDAYKGKP